MVPSQRLLVLGRAEEGNIACFIQLVHGILEGRLGSLFIVRPDPRCSIVEVGREDNLGTIDHEEWRVAGGSAGGHPQALEHRGKLDDPSSTKLVQPVEDPRLEALQHHVVRMLDLPVRVGVCHGGAIDADVVFIAESEELFPSELRAVVHDNGVWDSKRWMTYRNNSTACSNLITEIGRASLHFVNFSTATSKYV